MVQGISGNNDFGQSVHIQRDLNGTKSAFKKVDELDLAVEKTAAGVFIPYRRMMSVPKKIEEGDVVAAGVAGGLAFMTLPEDLRDVRAGYRQVKAWATGQKYEASYVTKKFQHDFSWLKGSLFEDWYKNTKSKTVKNVLKFLYAQDESIYRTTIGKKIRKFLGLTNGKGIETKTKDRFGNNMIVDEIKAPNAFAELTGRAMKRITVFGLVALALLELPKIFKSTVKGDNIAEQAGNTVKQTAKSGINVASIAAGIGYCGAIGAKHGGAFGSLLGMSAGAVIGSIASNKMQEFIA